jgi:hypothetical protein
MTGGLHLAPAPRSSLIYCFSFRLTPYQSRTSNELQDLTYGGVIIVTWLHKKTGPGDETVNGLLPHSHRGDVWLIHLPLGTSHKWDHPSTPVWIGLYWPSTDLLAESPDVTSFACLSPVMDSHCLIRFLFIHSSTDLLANSEWDATDWFRSCERMFRPRSCQMVCCFISSSDLMAWHQYRLNFVTSGQ